MGNTVRQLQIPESVDDALAIKGFAPALCRTLAAIACYDGVVTLAEYGALASSANALGNVSDNKVLMNTLVLRALLDEPEFAASCRQLAKEAKSVPEDVRRVAFDLAKPLIALQPREADTIAKRLAASLDLAEVPVSEWLAAFWQGTQQGVTELLSRLMSGRDARLERLELFGQLFDQPALREALERYRAERSSAAEQALRSALDEAKGAVLAEVETALRHHAERRAEHAVAETLRDLADALVEQVELRLASVRERALLQRRLFEEDLRRFLEDGANQIEVEMHDWFQHEDWRKPETWERFGRTQAALSLQARYRELKARYDAIMTQWQRELEGFAKEVGVARAAVFKAVDPNDLADLVPPLSVDARIKSFLDTASDLVLNVASTAAVGGAIGGAVAIKTGLVTGAVLTQVAGAAFTPVGLAIVGSIAVAGLYKYLASPEGRKHQEIKSKREHIIRGLEQLLEDPRAAHEKALNEVVERFHQVAEENYTPLKRDAQLAQKLLELEREVLARIGDNTRDYVKDLAVA